MFKSLRLKLLFYFFITNVIVLSVYDVFLYNTAKKGVLNTIDAELKMISVDVTFDFKKKGYKNAKDIADDLAEEFAIEPLFVKIVYYNKTAKKIEYESVSSKEYSWLFDIPLNEIGHTGSIYYFNKGNYRASSMLLFEKDEIKIFIQLAMQKDTDSPYLKQLSLGLIIATPIVLILFLLIANMLINKTLSPVKEVIGSVKSISSSNLSNRVSTNNIPSEINELVATFNHLLNNLEESFNKIISFSNDASHELKTPLTVIRGEIEVALKQERKPQEYKEVLQDILEESISIQKIIDQLLFLAKKEKNELRSDFEELYLDEIVTDSVMQIKKFAATKNIKINIKQVIPLTLCANETLLKIAITNLLRNAVIYSPKDSHIYLSLSENGDEYLLAIEDNGYGISENDLPFIFERFYRADKVRSRKEGGTGLGLSIVKMILDIHHYAIEISSIINIGTTVVIKIPKSQSPNLFCQNTI
jgi:heavy metal sensor kinase